MIFYELYYNYNNQLWNSEILFFLLLLYLIIFNEIEIDLIEIDILKSIYFDDLMKLFNDLKIYNNI